MHGISRRFAGLLTLAIVALAAGLVVALGVAHAGSGSSTPTPPVLYAGANSSLGGSVVVGSPLVSGTPTAALYVNGTLTLSGSATVKNTLQYIASKGATVPALSVFMPAARVSQLTQASQAVQKTGTVYGGLTLSGSASATYSSPITVNGNLTISGSGTYTFNSVYVTGNVSIANCAAKVSIASLYVGGTLSATGATSVSLGPTYVAGDTSLSGSGQWTMTVPQWTMGLLVTGGNLTVSGSGTYGGDGVGSDPKPITVLMTGASKSLTISGTPTICGLLYDASGALKSTCGGGAVKGTVLCGGGVTASGSLAVNYNASEAVTTLDTTPPTTTAALSLAANANGWNSSYPVTVKLTPTDNTGGSGVASTSYALTGTTVSGTKVNLSGTGTSVSVTPAGTYTLTYFSTDKAGNVEASHNLPINIDTTPPAGSLKINGAASWTKSIAVTLTASASDSGSGVALMRFSNDKSTWSAWQTYATSAAWTLSTGDGTKTVYAQYQDQAGNVSTATISATIGLDTVKPTVSISAPVNGTATNNATPTLSFSAADNSGGSGLSSTTYTLDKGSPVAASSPTTLAKLGDGPHTVTVTATDQAGNSASASVSFTVDTVKPTVSISAPVNGTATNNATPTLSFSAADNSGGSGLSSTTYTLDKGSPVAASSPTTLAKLGDGPHTVTVTATDQAGNSASASVSFTVDTTPPMVTIVSPADLSVTSQASPTLTFTAVDTGSGIPGTAPSAVVSVDGYLIGAGFESGETLPPLVDGVHTLTLTVYDAAGNSASASSTFTVGTVPPAVAITSPANGAALTNSTPELDYSVSDPSATVDVSVDGSPQTIASGQRVSTLTNGSHTITVQAADQAGTSSASSSFMVDATDPPSSTFTYAPSQVYEGDVLGLYADATGNPDGSEADKTWQWTVSEDGKHQDQPLQTYDGPIGYLVPDTAGTWTVTLTVTDTVTGLSSPTSQTIDVLPQAPRVHALDVQVQAGQSAKLVARFLDPGWNDTHTATWTIPGMAPISGTVSEDHVAAMASGYVSGTTPPLASISSPLACSLTVYDSDGTSTTVPFTITVLPDTPPADEAASTSDPFGSAINVQPETAQLHWIQQSGDVDIFKVTQPDGSALPYGTEVLATLRDLPADYNLAVIQDLGADVDAQDAAAQADAFENSDFANAPYAHSPYAHSPYAHSPLNDIPYAHSPYAHSPIFDTPYAHSPYAHSPFLDVPYAHSPFLDTPYAHSPYAHSPYAHSPFLYLPYAHSPADQIDNSLDGFPLSQMSYTGLSDDTTAGSDVSFEELGFDNAQMAGKRVAGFSAGTPTQDAVVLAQTDFVGGATYILVDGENGACSDLPFTLQVETSMPLDPLTTLNNPDQPLVSGGSTTSATAVSPPAGVSPETLFVTQPERIDALYGAGSWQDTVLPALQRACASPLVDGEVLTVPASIYTAWDEQPWEPSLANQVSDQIEALTSQALTANPSIRYVVLVGDDQVIPQRRIPDETVLGNEAEYADTAYLNSDSALLGSMHDSMILTDDCYGDPTPVAWNGGSLYIPDVGVSRLVETPFDIVKCIDTFMADDGLLGTADSTGQPETSSVVTGFDFMDSGAKAVSNILAKAGLSPTVDETSLIGESWTADQVREGLLGAPADVGDLNAHFTHFAGISAVGYEDWQNGQWDPGELLTSNDIANAPDFRGKLVFSMGCHSGLNVPDDESLTVDPSEGIDPGLDMAQATAQQGGVLVGNTGYGYGDTQTIAGSAALIGDLADQATQADSSAPQADQGQTIGLALAAAKREYLGSLSTVTPYDEKSSVEFTMYGMPQYRLVCTTHAPDAGPQSNGLQTPADAGLTLPGQSSPSQLPQNFTLNVIDNGQQRTYTMPLAEVQTATGSYLTAGGDEQATADRPIQPREVIDIGTAIGNPVRAAIVSGGTYVDVTGFDPAISTWTTEWDGTPPEYQEATMGWWPTDPTTVTSIDTAPGGTEQRLVVLAGQFKGTAAPGAATSGTERVWTSLTVTLMRATPSTDRVGPTVRSVDLFETGDTVTAKVDASDPSGIARIDVVQIGGGAAQSFAFTPSAGSLLAPGSDGTYDVSFPLPGVAAADVAAMVSVTDGAGNVTTVTERGALIQLPPSGSANLNGGAATTFSRVVTLDSSNVANATEMRTSSDGVNWTAWQPYEAHTLVGLTSLPGPKTVYAQYRNAGSNTKQLSPMNVTLSPAAVSAGGYHTLAVRSDGTLWAWGWSLHGQVGGPTDSNGIAWTPEQIGSESDWAAISAGGVHSLGLQSDGSLWAWGYNGDGELGDGSLGGSQASPEHIGSGTDWVAVSAGNGYSLALKSNGTLWAWGYNGDGELGNGTTSGTDVPEQIGTATNWVAISAGGGHSLALRSDGTLWAWGYNGDGELGDGTTANSLVPEQIGDANDWVAVSASGGFSLALKSDGTLWAWGENNYGQLGDGTTSDSYAPAQVGAETDWVAVSAGGYQGYWYSLAAKSDGTFWAWGNNQFGQLGDGTTTQHDSPEHIGGSSSGCTVSAGGNRALALESSGTVEAWGDDSYGQLGALTPLASNVPEQVFNVNDTTPPSGTTSLSGGMQTATLNSSVSGAVQMRTSTDNVNWTPWRPYVASTLVALSGLPGTKTVYAQYRDWGYNVLDKTSSVTLSTASVSAGMQSTLAMRDDGSIWGWGYFNTYGWLGNGNTSFQDTPGQAPGTWASMSSRVVHTLAIKTDGTLWACGSNSNGRLGIGGPVPFSTTFVQITGCPGGDNNWASVAAGSADSLALKTDGTLWACGDDTYGQLGDGKMPATDQSTLEQITGCSGGDSNWAVVSTLDHTLALKSDGTLWAWGRNDHGQVGKGSTSNVGSPVEIGTASDWVAVATGYTHSLALKSDGTLWAWGDDSHGQLGDGNATTTSQTSPEQITGCSGGDDNWVAIAAGSLFSLGLKSDGTLWAWGANGAGELGTGYPTDSHVPVRVGSATDWAAISAGEGHGTAEKSDGTLWAWGTNEGYGGLLGDGSHTDSHSPVQVLSPFNRVSTLAGTSAGLVAPQGVAYDPLTKDLVVTDNGTVRRVALNGAVTTIAGADGQPGTIDNADGLLARFNGPDGIACDSSGNIYVTCVGDQTVRKIAPDSAVTTLAGPGGFSFGVIQVFAGIACDAAGSVYVADPGNGIRKITPGGVVTTFATLGGAIPEGLAYDPLNGNIYVSEDAKIEQVDGTGAVSLLAGSGTVGTADGTGSGASFSGPTGLACAPSGIVYTVDGNNRIRTITAAQVITVAGSTSSGDVDGIGSLALFNLPSGAACDADGTVYIADTSNGCIRRLR